MGMLLKRWNDPEEIKEWLVDRYSNDNNRIKTVKILKTK